MTDELDQIAGMEGGTANRPPKPIKDMTDEELTEWVQRVRNNLTQYQSLVAEARIGGGKKKDSDTGSLEMFE